MQNTRGMKLNFFDRFMSACENYLRDAVEEKKRCRQNYHYQL